MTTKIKFANWELIYCKFGQTGVEHKCFNYLSVVKQQHNEGADPPCRVDIGGLVGDRCRVFLGLSGDFGNCRQLWHVHSSFPFMVIAQVNDPPVDKSSGFQIPPSSNNLRLRSFDKMISPRNSNNYDRLEGGLGPTRTTKKFGWKKFAIGAGVLIALVYFFGPRAKKPLPWKSAAQQRPMDVPGKYQILVQGLYFMQRSSHTG
jgi:hypothetical protein